MTQWSWEQWVPQENGEPDLEFPNIEKLYIYI